MLSTIITPVKAALFFMKPCENYLHYQHCLSFFSERRLAYMPRLLIIQ